MATPLSLIKPGLKTSLVEAMYNEIVSNTNGYYYFLGKTLEWVAGDVATPPGSHVAYEAQTREEMIFLKKITAADVSYTIPRYDWISGQVFDMYDDQIGKQVTVAECVGLSGAVSISGIFDLSQIGVGWLVSGTGITAGTVVTSITGSTVTVSNPTTSTVSTLVFTKTAYSGAATLETSRFYCITNERNVYKCLSNNNNTPSTSKPFATTHEPIITDDGYVWKFMYTIPSALTNKFTTLTDIPVTTAVKAPYFSRGAITSVNLLDYGQDYAPGDVLIVTGDGHLSENVFRLIAISVVDGGIGYASAPTISVQDPFDTVAFVAEEPYLVGQHVKVSNRIYLVEQGGVSGSTAPTHTSSTAISNGTTAMRFAGISVSTTPTVTDTTIESVAMSGVVGYITLTNAGGGYDPLDPPSVSISGTGTGATAVANVSASGFLTGITITARGNNYSSATATIDPPTSNEITFNPSTAVNLTNNTITSSSHGFGTGDEVTYSNGGGTSVGGLTNTSQYFVVAVDENTVKLTTTYRDAVDETNFVDLTSGAVGSAHTLTESVIQATATVEVFYGYGYTFTPSVTVSDPFIADVVWDAAAEVTEGDVVRDGIRFYEVVTAGTNNLGTTAPTHTSGTEENGEVDLEFIGSSASLSMFVEKTKAQIAPIIRDGQIVDVVIQDPGVGYTVAEIDAFGGGTGAQIVPNISFGDLNSRQANIELLAIPGTIDAIDVLSPGLNYSYATITVTGDGFGCTADAVIEQGVITKINVINPGSGYTKATVVIEGNGGATQAYARAIVSPYEGHGKNAVKELFAKDISLATTIARDRNQGFVVSNDYRQLGIIKNPEKFNSSQRYSAFSGSTCFNITGSFTFLDLEVDMLLQDAEMKQYRVVALPEEEPSGLVSILVQSLDNAVPVSGTVLTYGTNQATVSIVSSPTVNKYSGDLLFIDNRNSFQPTDEQTLSLKTVIRL